MNMINHKLLILFSLIANRMLNICILLNFPEMAREMLYCSQVKIFCFPAPQMEITIWKLMKNRFT